jgi:CheY-like chemotaxis protein
MPVSYRYRILFYHENQKWVSRVVTAIDTPQILLSFTDQASVVEKHLETGEIDILLTGATTMHFMLENDEESSGMTFRQMPIWETLQKQNIRCKVIILCSQKEVAFASDLVQRGVVADYCIVNPLMDKNRVYITIMKVLEQMMLHDIIEQQVLQGEKVPKTLVESIELLQTIRHTSEEDKGNDTGYVARNNEEEILDTEEINTSWGAWDEQYDDKGTLEPEEEPIDEAAEEEDLSEYSASIAFSSISDDDAASHSPFNPKPDDVFSSLKNMFENQATGKPVLKTVRDPVPQDPKESELTGFYSAWGKKSDVEVLLIGSNWEDITAIERALALKDIRMIIAHTPEEGLSFLSRQRYQLLLLDMNLSGQTGFEFLGRLRVNGPQASIPAIILSSQGQEEYVMKSIQAGANYFLVKPIQADRLLEEVLKYVQRS